MLLLCRQNIHGYFNPERLLRKCSDEGDVSHCREEDSDSGINDVELEASRRVVAFLKSKIGGDGVQTLVADQIAAANTYWHLLLSNSTATLARLVQEHKCQAALLSVIKLPPT